VRRAELSLWARVLGAILRRQRRSDVTKRLDAGLDVLRRVEWED
jgi:hypothetical protein